MDRSEHLGFPCRPLLRAQPADLQAGLDQAFVRIDPLADGLVERIADEHPEGTTLVSTGCHAGTSVPSATLWTTGMPSACRSSISVNGRFGLTETGQVVDHAK